MKLIHPALTLVSLLLVSMPAMASPIAIAASINWGDLIAAGCVLTFLLGAFLFIWGGLGEPKTDSNISILILLGFYLIFVFSILVCGILFVSSYL